MENKFNKAAMDMAIITSKLSYCNRRKVGAVITKDNRVIVNGYNGTITGTSNECEYPILTCSKCKTVFEDGVFIGDKHCDDGYIEVRLKTNPYVIHAEENAIIFAAKNGISIKDCSIFVTTAPCISCAKLIAESGLREVFYNEKYTDTLGIDLLTSVNIKVTYMGNEDLTIPNIDLPNNLNTTKVYNNGFRNTVENKND